MEFLIEDANGVEQTVTFGTCILDSVSGTEGIVVGFNEHIAGCLYIDISYKIKGENGQFDHFERSLCSHDAVFINEGNTRLKEIYEENKPQSKLEIGSRCRQISTGAEGYVAIIFTGYTGEISYQLIREFASRGKPVNGSIYVTEQQVEFLDKGVSDKIAEQKKLRSEGKLTLALHDKVKNIVTGATGKVVEVAHLNGGTILGTVITPPVKENKRPFEFTTDIELLEKI